MKNKNVLQGFILSLLLAPIISFSQSPVLTNLMISPMVDEVYTHYRIDSSFITIEDGGIDQVWDYSNLAFSDNEPWMYVSTEATMHAADFPGSNIASMDENMCMAEFYQTSNNKLSYAGIFMDGLIMFFEDYKEQLHYPFSYGDSFTDDFSTIYNQSAMHHRTGTVTVEADAYGTLMLPWGTLNEVLRIKTIEEMTDTFTFNNTLFQYDYYYEIYKFYKPGIREPLMHFIYSSINGGDLLFTGHYINETEVNAIAENSNGKITIYPNPVRNKLNIETTTSNPSSHYLITDIDGKLVWEGKYQFNGQKTLDVDFLKSGVYFLKIISGEEFIVKKFIKE